ncbi:MAG: carbohydate-binding domain-containing protein [Bacteroidetes bacterium]|nr:carbohydate-binding domain-containing protein [Bacteroidota bacterium]
MKYSNAGFVPILVFLLTISAFGQKNSLFPVKDLKITWKLLTNNYEKKPENLSSITLENTGKKTIPSSGWTLFFNYGRHITPGSVIGNVSIEHVNGDIFRLIPTSGSFSLEPKATNIISFVSEGEVLNYTAAPDGYYIVFDQDPSHGYSLTQVTDLPIVDSTVHFVTPADTYKENEFVRDIPVDELPPILPTPAVYRKQSGNCVLDSRTPILGKSKFPKESDYLANEISSLTLNKAEVAEDAESSAVINLEFADLPNEAYALTVTPTSIYISAGSGSGIFYGIQSLLSLFPPDSRAKKNEALVVPCIEVRDAPRFGYRGLLIDVARNFQTKDQLERILDLMAFYKLNVLHLHCTDDEGWRIEIPSLPELTQVGANRGHTLDSKEFLPPSYSSGPDAGHMPASGFYTRADFIDILKYANERHIQVIPEIESPGHGRAAIKAMDARYEKYISQGNEAEAKRYLLRDRNDKSVYSSAQLWTDNVMCVAMPSVYTFLEKVFDELIAMYAEAKAPLTTIHLGGDEVPAGVWENSPLCEELMKKEGMASVDELWYYYFSKVHDLLKSRKLVLSGWEEIAMRKTMLEGQKHYIPNPQFVGDDFHVDVWNNGIGWGSEDLPYRLANAGYKVVLSCVSNQYFDLAYEKSADEPGYYWGGFHDVDKPFYFIPFDYYRNTQEDTGGNPISPALFVGKDHLTDYGKSNILGIQGLLWAENVRNPEIRDYLLLPKLLALAERAWAPDPEWATIKDEEKYKEMYNEAWSVFASEAGKRELTRLSYLDGGFKYRIPPAGAVVKDGFIHANCQMPGIQIRYTEDGSWPGINSKLYTGPFSAKGLVKMATFSVDGRRGRVISVEKLDK